MINSVSTEISVFQRGLHLKREGYTYQAEEGMEWRWLKVWENIRVLQILKVPCVLDEPKGSLDFCSDPQNIISSGFISFTNVLPVDLRLCTAGEHN